MQLNTAFSKFQINNAIARINNDLLTHFEFLFNGVTISSAAEILKKIFDNVAEFEIVLFSPYGTEIKAIRKFEKLTPTYTIEGLDNNALKALQTLDKLIKLNI